MRRLSFVLLPAALVAALIGGYGLWHLSDNLPGLGRSVESGTAKGGRPFTLIDQAGATRAPTGSRGRYILLNLGCSSLHGVRPTTRRQAADARHTLAPNAEQ